MGLGPEASKLEGGFQNDTCQHQSPHGRTSSQKWLPLVSVFPRVTSICPLPLWETIQDQQVRLTQSPFKLLLFPWVLEHVRFCVCPLRVETISHGSLALLKLSSSGFQSQTFWGLVFLVQDPHAGDHDVELRSLTLWAESI